MWDALESRVEYNINYERWPVGSQQRLPRSTAGNTIKTTLRANH